MGSWWLEYTNAFRNVTRQYRRSLFGIATVTFGVVALLLAAGFIEWIFWATREGTIQNGLGHIHVMRPGYLDDGQANPMSYLIDPQLPQLVAIKNIPGISAVAPRLAFNGMISHGDATISFIGEGVDPAAEQEASGKLLITFGENLSSADPKGIVLGRGLAENLGAKVGDAVVLLAPVPGGSVNAVEGTVRGLFNTVSKAYDDSALRMPLPTAQKLLRVSGVHRFVLVLKDTAQTAQTTAALRTQFGGANLEFVPWYEMADFYQKVVTLLSKQVSVVEFIIAVIIILSISNTMMMGVIERTAEIGTCLAIGNTQREILRQFIFEGLTIGLIGGALGVALGWLLSTLISWMGIPMPPPPGMSQGYTGEIMFTWRLGLETFVLALGTTLLASFYPAWKASRMQIVDALRHSR